MNFHTSVSSSDFNKCLELLEEVKSNPNPVDCVSKWKNGLQCLQIQDIAQVAKFIDAISVEHMKLFLQPTFVSNACTQLIDYYNYKRIISFANNNEISESTDKIINAVKKCQAFQPTFSNYNRSNATPDSTIYHLGPSLLSNNNLTTNSSDTITCVESHQLKRPNSFRGENQEPASKKQKASRLSDNIYIKDGLLEGDKCIVDLEKIIQEKDLFIGFLMSQVKELSTSSPTIVLSLDTQPPKLAPTKQEIILFAGEQPQHNSKTLEKAPSERDGLQNKEPELPKNYWSSKPYRTTEDNEALTIFEENLTILKKDLDMSESIQYEPLELNIEESAKFFTLTRSNIVTKIKGMLYEDGRNKEKGLRDKISFLFNGKFLQTPNEKDEWAKKMENKIITIRQAKISSDQWRADIWINGDIDAGRIQEWAKSYPNIHFKAVCLQIAKDIINLRIPLPCLDILTIKNIKNVFEKNIENFKKNNFIESKDNKSAGCSELKSIVDSETLTIRASSRLPYIGYLRSFHEMWQNDATCLANQIFRMYELKQNKNKPNKLGNSLLNTVLNFLTNQNNMIPSHYSNTILPKLLNTFADKLPKTKIKVLDPSAGWGDRLISALLCEKVDSYYGIDPNSALIPKYQKIVEKCKHIFCNTCKREDCIMCGKKFTFFQGGSEDIASYGENRNNFDISFTSPPFFDREIYYDPDPESSKNQSHEKYGNDKTKQIEENYNNWEKKFLAPSLENTVKSVREEGLICIDFPEHIKIGKKATKKSQKSTKDSQSIFDKYLPGCTFVKKISFSNRRSENKISIFVYEKKSNAAIQDVFSHTL